MVGESGGALHQSVGSARVGEDYGCGGEMAYEFNAVKSGRG